jgi:flagellar hook-associated protein 1 FlgK
MNISGLYTALSGMNAQKRILDVTAHNVANVNTPGYHRQRVTLEPAGVTSVSAVFAGRNQGTSGVNIASVDRVLDALAESRLLRETAMQAQTSLTSTTLDRIEQAFPEPSDIGIAAQLDDFWAGWSDLSTRPEDLSNRTQLLERTQTVIDALRRASGDLDALEDSSRQSVVQLGTDINDIAGRIAELNRTIVGSATGANDLLDQRDQLVTKMAELSGAISRPAGGGQIDVYIGGRIIVSGGSTQTVDGTGGQLRWSSDNSAVTAPSSKAAALAETINDTVSRYRLALDAVAESLVTSVNTLHATGYDLTATTGRNFFDPAGVTAATISLSADVAGQPEHVAAGAPGPGVPGRFDGELARAMAGLAGAPAGPDARYRSMVSTLGVEVRTAVRRDEIQGQLVQAAANRADTVGGVSIDEEMANMMSAQRAFEAAARVLTAIDEMMGVLIQRTGLVGR